MTIILDSTAGLFTRVGKAGYVLHITNEFRGALTGINPKLPAEVADMMAEVEGAMNLRNCYQQIPSVMNSVIAGMGSMNQGIRQATQALLIEMANDDNPLHEKTVTYAAAELIKQMLAATEYVQANTVTGAVTPGGTNVGTGKVIVSVLDGSGKALEYAYDETIDVIVANSTTAGSETLTFMGEAAVADKLSEQWPAGSPGRLRDSTSDIARPVQRQGPACAPPSRWHDSVCQQEVQFPIHSGSGSPPHPHVQRLDLLAIRAGAGDWVLLDELRK